MCAFVKQTDYALDLDADPDDPDAWEVQDSVYLLYEENEKDYNK